MKEIYPRNSFFEKRRESNFKSRKDLNGRKGGLQVLRRKDLKLEIAPNYFAVDFRILEFR